MSTPTLFAAFYDEIWDRGNVDAARDLLTETFVFRGSPGADVQVEANRAA